jgi:hypothetical protein
MLDRTKIVFITGAVLIALLSGCQSIKQPKGTSQGYNSFRFIDKATTVDNRFEEPSEFRDRAAQNAIWEQFESHGLGIETKDADLIVAYLFVRQDNVSTLVVPTYYGPDYREIQSYAHKKGVLKGNNADFFEVGAIVIDILDAKTNKLIYRGFAKRDIKGVTAEAEKRSLIDSAVQEALAGFLNDQSRSNES